MGRKKISELTEKTLLDTTDSIPLQEDGGSTKRATVSTLTSKVITLLAVLGYTDYSSLDAATPNDTDKFAVSPSGGVYKTLTLANLASNILARITGATAKTSGSSPAWTPIITDAGVLKNCDYTYFKRAITSYNQVTTTPTTGSTQTVDKDTDLQVLNHTSTIATMTLVLPGSADVVSSLGGFRVHRVFFRSEVTTLTISVDGFTSGLILPSHPASATAGTTMAFVFNATSAFYIRIQ